MLNLARDGDLVPDRGGPLGGQLRAAAIDVSAHRPRRVDGAPLLVILAQAFLEVLSVISHSADGVEGSTAIDSANEVITLKVNLLNVLVSASSIRSVEYRLGIHDGVWRLPHFMEGWLLLDCARRRNGCTRVMHFCETPVVSLDVRISARAVGRVVDRMAMADSVLCLADRHVGVAKVLKGAPGFVSEHGLRLGSSLGTLSSPHFKN